ncbi:cytochrome P450 [Cadophora sp. DSE1049]|nr:cytochrome P450 [Cadophora sp. DSE1049]
MAEPFSIFGLSLPTFGLLVGGLAVSFYIAYQKALPKPIPGIPYNKEVTSSILGDVVSMVKHVNKTKEIMDWMMEHNIRHNSPIVQVFTRPFARPWVVVTDFREAQDVLLRRTKEFDRSNFFGDIFLGLLPKHHISMKTHDEAFKKQRRWLMDLMTPGFLHGIAAPQIYTACEDMLDVWQEKARISQGHPFEAPSDVYHAALDAVWSLVFGADISNSTTKSAFRSLSSTQNLQLPNEVDEEAIIPEAPLPATMAAIVSLVDTLTISITSPMPVLTHWIIRQLPNYRRTAKIRDNLIRDEVEKTRIRFEGKKEKDLDVRCAMDDIMRRELSACEKEGRAPMYHSRAMYDEIFGLVVAAHDTTATAITWALKFLADNPAVQDKLRAEILSGHATVVAEKRKPTAAEIAKTSIPYLDATQEEIMRCSLTEAGVVRTATTDVELLGKRIPKGTDVFFMGNGPSIFSPAFQIDDSLRSPTALNAKERIGSWDPSDMAKFNPERWLVDGEKGGKEFSAAAGPLLTFGMGPRGCYGRRLAYVEMKIFLTLIVWMFELQKCPLELSSYKSVDKLTHAPQQCFIRLKKVA